MIAHIKEKMKRIIVDRPNSSASDLKQCIDNLLSQRVSDEQLDLAEGLLTGRLANNGQLTSGEDIAFLEYSGWARLVNLLFEHGRLNYEIFKQSVWRAYRVLYCLGGRKHAGRRLDQLFDQLHQWQCGQHISDECLATLTDYAGQLAWEMAQDFSFHARRVLRSIYHLTGSRYLILCADYHAKYLPRRTKLVSKFDPDKDDTVAETLVHLLRNFDLESLSVGEQESLVARLEDFPHETRQALLPFARDGKNVLCLSLRWEDGVDLVEFIHEISTQAHKREEYIQADIPNSDDPASGTIPLARAMATIDKAGYELAFEIIDLFYESGENVRNTLLLLEAVAGRNRAKIEKGLKRHSQIAIKAYGLLPLEGDETVLDRYLALKQSAKDGQKFGQMRRATHAGAVQAALENLAQVARYTDASRLEWAMEAQLADEVAPPGRKWTVDNYELELKVDGVDVSIIIHKDDRRLKSVPKSVRESNSYKDARAAVDQLRSQISRLRLGLLEGLISTGETLPRSDLEALLRLPVARDLCLRLIWKTDGVIGLLDADEIRLFDLEGHEHPIGNEVGLAHSYDLFQANELAAWQREIVHRRIVQPIKQTYRELYILTPAERETHTYSDRFAGHVIDARVAARLFGSRGWRIESGDVVTPYKTISGFRAVFELVDAWHYLGGDVPITTDKIFFQDIASTAHDNWRWHGHGYNWLPLEEVPSLVFSEVMRDADLIVSVGQREGEARISNETFEQRGNLVRALLDDLGLPGVSVEGHFAYVEGKLARYRVHLGSAVIHIEPGNYLCIVPDRWGTKHDKLFLPFVDEKDSKISEVISKILFLLTDDKIKDESILRQINRQKQP